MNLNPRLFAAAFAMATTICCAFSQTGGQPKLGGFAASPVLIRDKASPNHAGIVAIEIQSFQQTPLTISLQLQSMTPADWTYNPVTGQPNRHDCSTWFATPQFTQTIAPNETKVLQLKYKTPALPPGVYWCVANLIPGFNRGGGGIVLQYQIPIIFLVGNPIRPDLRFAPPIAAMEGKDKKMLVAVPFENLNEGFATVGTRVEIHEMGSGRLVLSGKVDDKNLFPMSKRALQLEFPILPDGKYVISARNQIGSRTFPPMSQSIAIKSSKLVALDSAAALSLSPIESSPNPLHVQGQPGGTRASTVRFSNGSDHAMALKLTAHSLNETDAGSYEAGPLLNSNSDVSVSFSTEDLNLEPGRSMTVVVKSTVPEGTTGEHWFCILADSLDGKTMPDQVTVQLTIPHTEQPGLEVTNLTITKAKGRAAFASYDVHNTGNVALRPLAQVHILQNLTDVAKLEVPDLGDGGILPGATLRNRVQFPLDLKPGPYILEVSYQYSEKLAATKRLAFEAPATKGKARGKGNAPGRNASGG